MNAAGPASPLGGRWLCFAFYGGPFVELDKSGLLFLGKWEQGLC